MPQNYLNLNYVLSPGGTGFVRGLYTIFVVGSIVINES